MVFGREAARMDRRNLKRVQSCKLPPWKQVVVVIEAKKEKKEGDVSAREATQRGWIEIEIE